MGSMTPLKVVEQEIMIGVRRWVMGGGNAPENLTSDNCDTNNQTTSKLTERTVRYRPDMPWDDLNHLLRPYPIVQTTSIMLARPVC
jgi:hypothetical protein